MPWPACLPPWPHPPAGDLGVVGAVAQRSAQVGLGPGEQAVADLAVGGQPDPVAGAAERLRDRGDDADRVVGAGHLEQLGRRTRPRSAASGSSSTSSTCSTSRARISSAVTISVRCQPCWASSGICSMNRSSHPFAIAPQQVGASWSLTPRSSTVLILTGCSPAGLAAASPASTSGSRSPGQRGEGVRVERVEEMLTGPARPPPVAGGLASPIPLVVSAIDGRGRSAAIPATHDLQVPAQQRLAAGEPDSGDAQPVHRDPIRPQDLLVGEQLVGRQPVEPFGRHAVGAAQVAPVGQRDPQVPGRPVR